MFNSISWQEFLTTIAVAIGSYYAITTLLFYSSEITNIFRQREPKQIASETNEDQNDSTESNDLMGKVKYDTEVNAAREKSVSSEELQVQSSNENEETIKTSLSNNADALLLGTIADLLQEVKVLAEVVSDSSKEETVSLFKSLLSRYPQLVGTHCQEAVSFNIYDSCKAQCEFDLELNEITSWWPEVKSNSNDNQ